MDAQVNKDMGGRQSGEWQGSRELVVQWVEWMAPTWLAGIAISEVTGQRPPLEATEELCLEQARALATGDSGPRVPTEGKRAPSLG